MNIFVNLLEINLVRPVQENVSTKYFLKMYMIFCKKSDQGGIKLLLYQLGCC